MADLQRVRQSQQQQEQPRGRSAMAPSAMNAAQMHCDDGPDEASMINAVLNSNAEYMQLMAEAGDPNRPSGDNAQANAARQKLIAAVAAEVRKQSNQQQQQQQQQHQQHQQNQTSTAVPAIDPARPARTPAKRANKRRVASSNESQDFTMQQLPVRSDNGYAPPHSLASTSQQPQQEQRRFPPPSPWQTSPQHFFHPSSQQQHDESPQQQQHSGNNNAQYTPSHSQQQHDHQHATTTPTATPHAFSGNAFAAIPNNNNHRATDSAVRQARSREQSQSGAEQQQQMQSSAETLSLNIRRFALESPIGLQQQHLPVSQLSGTQEANSIAYNRPPEQLKAMLAARGSPSPLDNLDKSGSAAQVMPGSASLARMGSATEARTKSKDRTQRSPTSSQMLPSGSSPGALMSSRYRTSSPSAAATAASLNLNSSLGLANANGMQSFNGHRHTQSLGQMVQVMTSQPGIHDGGIHASVVSPSAGIPAPANQRRAAAAGMLLPLSQTPPTQQHSRDTLYPAAPHGRQLSNGNTKNGAALRSASPNGSIASLSFTSSSSQHSRAVSSQSSVLSGFSRHNTGDSSFSSADNSMDSRQASQSCSTSEADDLMSITSIDTTTSSGGTPSGASASVTTSKRLKTKIDDLDRKRVCEYAAAHPRQKQGDIAAVFDIERSTVSKILKQKEKWLAIDASDSYLNRDRTIRYPNLERHLLDWTRAEADRGRVPDNAQLREQIVTINLTKQLNLGEDFAPTDIWLETFRLRNKIGKAQADALPSTPGPPSSSSMPALAPASAQSQVSAPGPAPTSVPTSEVLFPWNTSSGTEAQQERQFLEGLGINSQPSEMKTGESNTNVQATPQARHGFDNAQAGSSGGSSRRREPLARTFSDTDIGEMQSFQTPTKRRKGLGGAAVSPTSMSYSMSAESAFVSPRTSARRKQDALRRQREQENTPSGALKLDLRGIETTMPRSRSVARVDSLLDGAADLDSFMDDGAALPSTSRRNRQTSGENMGTASPAALGDAGQTVSVDDARDSLDVVLRFLREQPEDFCPRGHYLVFGHLEGALAAAAVPRIEENSQSQSRQDATEIEN